MKRSNLLALGLAFLLASAAGLAQQSQRINYRVTNYFSVAPEKVAPMLEEARTTERKLMQQRIASGENIAYWVLLREAYRGIPASSYNYAISVTFDGAPQTPNAAKRRLLQARSQGTKETCCVA